MSGAPDITPSGSTAAPQERQNLAPSLRGAPHFLQNLAFLAFSLGGTAPEGGNDVLYAEDKLFVDLTTIGYGMMGIVLLLFKDYVDEYHPSWKFLNSNRPIVSIIASVLLLCYIVLTGVFGGGQFIYFQF